MSIDKILCNKIIQLPNKFRENKADKPVGKDAFDKELQKAQGGSSSIEPTEQATGPPKIPPSQTNYHILAQFKSAYTTDQLYKDALEYIITGKAPKFDNPKNETEFALKVAEKKMWSRKNEI